MEAEKAQVKKVVDQIAQAMEAEDVEAISAIVAHDADMVNFGTDATERWVGWDALQASIEQQFAAFDNQQVSVRDQVIKVGASGTTAWYSQIMDWNLDAGGEVVNLEGMRASGVWEKRDGKWKIVQMHFSVGVAGQAAEY
ncbi:MAG: nuclear transport factor 2 family protein [Calditrichaceae bacterium]|nr:nuclear transport factor 2 family protein [Calditrichaceae bacterium]